MKCTFKSAKLPLCLLFSLFTCTLAFGQWNPQTQQTSGAIYRSGNVGVGLSQNPNAKLHVNQTFQSDGELLYIPLFRLERSYPSATYKWDFEPSDDLKINKVDGFASKQALSINLDEVKATSKKLILGYSPLATSQTGEEMTFGFDDNFRGSYIAFSGTYRDQNEWEGPFGKAVIHSKQDGSLNFLTADDNTDITAAQGNSLTITPDGTTIVGDHEPVQYLNIASDKTSILRFDRLGQARDYELVANDDGELDFRGGFAGQGGVLPSLMKIKADGKLAIGTDDTPNELPDGDDISAYRLYVEGGILTKEVRVRTIWSDYVFYDDYNLLSLEEVEDHIEEHGHLHNTPSAEKIERSGLELGSMMANQQEKIEEIYLHLIEMEKKVIALEEENHELKKQMQEMNR